jgi:nitroreductase
MGCLQSTATASGLPSSTDKGEGKMGHQNETLRTIHSLRSTHGNFSDKEVKDEDLRTILNAAIRAANSSARQCYSIVVVEDRKLMKQVTGYAGSKVLIFCVDYNRLIDTARYLGYTYDVGRTIWFITASTDTILAAQTAAIAARSLGIDSLFTNGIHRGDPRRVYDLLKLPEKHCFPLIALILGYATKEPEFLKGRLNGPGIIHFGEYHRLTDQELMDIVKQYDDPERHLGLIQDWKEKGFDHYLDWFYKVWSRPADRKQQEDIFYDILMNAQFLPDHTQKERNE